MTARQMEAVLRMPVERRILWLEDVWDSIRPQARDLRIPDGHKRELDRRLEKYSGNESALLTEKQLKHAVDARR